MIIKAKRIPIKNKNMGRDLVEEIRKLYGDNKANEVKLINEISFNVPVYDYYTKEIVYHIPETNDWYLEFPEEIKITNY